MDGQRQIEEFVRLEVSHAEALLEAAGCVRNDIASGHRYGLDEESHAENTARLEAAYRALRAKLERN